MQNSYNHLINEVLKNLDWDMVLGVHRMFKKGVGCEPHVIPGVKRIDDPEKITVKDLKNELKNVLKFIISRGSGEFNYGLWYVSWYDNDDDSYFEFEEEEEFDEENPDLQSWFPTKLQVVLAPQKMAVVDLSPPSYHTPNVQTSPVALEKMLDDAIKKEDYELANKLKEVIAHQEKEKKTDEEEDK
jgi:hypothetical protein